MKAKIRYVDRDTVVEGRHTMTEVAIDDMTPEVALVFAYNIYVAKKVKGCPFNAPVKYAEDDGTVVYEFDYTDTRDPAKARAVKKTDMFSL